ncbi:MAG: hypothetical protein ABL903_20265 [Methylococcales bacterium]
MRSGIPDSMKKYEGYFYPDDSPIQFVTSESTDKEEVPLYKESSDYPSFEE